MRGGKITTISRTFAYCRVLPTDQTTDNQVQEIATASLSSTKARAIVETVSGSVAAKEGKGFTKLLDKLEVGDVLIVTKLDRPRSNSAMLANTWKIGFPESELVSIRSDSDSKAMPRFSGRSQSSLGWIGSGLANHVSNLMMTCR